MDYTKYLLTEGDLAWASDMSRMRNRSATKDRSNKEIIRKTKTAINNAIKEQDIKKIKKNLLYALSQLNKI
jgi:hypothetical protein